MMRNLAATLLGITLLSCTPPESGGDRGHEAHLER